MYNKKRQKVKFKIRLEFVTIIVAVALMITLSIVLRLPNDSQKIINSYNGALGEDHVFVQLTFDELYEEMKKDTYTFVYFGSPECETCVNEIATINQVAVEWDVETVYYVDATNYIIDEDAEDYEEDKDLTAEIKEIETKLAAKATNVETAISLEFTPAIWVFNDNEVVFNSNDFLNEEEDGMTISWSLISKKAFYVNLPEYTG